MKKIFKELRKTFAVILAYFFVIQGQVFSANILGGNDGWAYFSGTQRSSIIYSCDINGKNAKVINSKDGAESIRVSNNWIYYINRNDNYNLYRINSDGKSRSIVIKAPSNKRLGNVQLAGDYVYFQYYGTMNSESYIMKNDGTHVKAISEYPFNFKASNGWIYYKAYSNGVHLYKMKYDGTSKTKVSDAQISEFEIDNEWIYYSDQKDKNCLYKMKVDGTSPTKISDTQIYGNFNISDGWIYFSMSSSSNSISKTNPRPVFKSTIYKIKIDGTSKAELMDYPGYYTIYNGYMYYSNNKDNYKLYKIKTDGTLNTKLSNEPVYQFNIINNKIYYINFVYKEFFLKVNQSTSSKLILDNVNVSPLGVKDGYVYYIDFSQGPKVLKKKVTGGQTMKVNDSYLGNPCIDRDWIYFSDVRDSYKLYRMKFDGSQKTKLTDDRTIDFQMSNDWIYYKTDSHSPYIYRIKKDGSQKSIALNQNNTYPFTVYNDWIYYTNFNDSSTSNKTLYKVKGDGTGKTIINKNFKGNLDYVIDGNYIYYVIVNNLYKMKTDGSNISKVNIEPTDEFNILNGWIYYSNFLDSGRFYRAKIDGSNKQLLY